MSFLLRLLINAAALWVTTRIIPGVEFIGSPAALIGVALVFGVLNAIVRPLLLLLSLPLVLITLGLFTLILNGIMLWLTSALSGALGLGFRVHGALAAILGALVVSIVSVALTVFVGRERRDRGQRL
jgi:putative membrane protein